MPFLLGETQTYLVSSNTKVSGTNSQFSHKIEMPQTNIFDRVCVLNCRCAHSYYQVNENKNSFYVDIGGGEVTVTVPIGNYTKQGIANKLEECLQDTMNVNFSVTYPLDSDETQTGKLRFFLRGSLSFSFRFDSTSNDLLGIMGFETTTYNSSSNELFSEIPISTHAPLTLLLGSDIVYGQQDGNRVLQEIDLGEEDQFNDITFVQNDVLGNSRRLAHTGHRFFNFWLEDGETRELINLRGRSIIFTLLIFRANHFPNFALENLKIDNIEKIKQNEKDQIEKIEKKEKKEKKKEIINPHLEHIQKDIENKKLESSSNIS
jgi:hypothetical protein